jgi:hypothetical protein
LRCILQNWELTYNRINLNLFIRPYKRREVQQTLANPDKLRGRGHPDSAIIRINEANYSPKRQTKNLEKMNGKSNNTDSADENKIKKYHCRAFI